MNSLRSRFCFWFGSLHVGHIRLLDIKINQSIKTLKDPTMGVRGRGRYYPYSGQHRVAVLVMLDVLP